MKRILVLTVFTGMVLGLLASELDEKPLDPTDIPERHEFQLHDKK